MDKKNHINNLTVEDIRSKFPPRKKRIEKYNLWVRVLRGSSCYLAWLFLKLKIPANTVTYISLIIGVLGCILVASGNYYYMIFGAILINFYALLDGVDGDIARYSNTCSKYGEFLDSFVGVMIAVFLFTCAGVGVFNHPDFGLNYFIHLSGASSIKGVFLFLGCWASLCYIAPRFIGSLFQKALSDEKIVSRDDIFGSSGGIINIISYNLFNTNGILMPILLITVSLNYLSFFVLLVAIINSAAFLVLILLLFRSAKSFEGN